MNGIRASFENGRYVAGEDDYIVGSVKTDLHAQPRGIVFCHGSGQVMATTIPSGPLFSQLAANATLHIGDLGGQTWGSDLVVTRIQQAIDLLRNTYGCTKIGLVGASMGGLNALNYIVRHYDQLECAALLIPATNIRSLRANPYLTVRWPEIDAIYGAPPAANYSGHNPIDFVSALSADFPMKMWWSTNDPLVYPADSQAFIAAMPHMESQSMGAVSHAVPDQFNKPIRYWMDQHLVA